MKKKCLLSLLVALCFTYISSFAQISPNSVFLGGQIGMYNLTKDNSSGTQATEKDKAAIFNISVGKAFKENSIYGVNINYSSAKVESIFNGRSYTQATLNLYNFGLFHRKYKNLGKQFYFFTEVGIAYISSKESYFNTAGTETETIKKSGVTAFLTPGLSYKITNNLFIEVAIPNLANVQYLSKKDITGSAETKDSEFLLNTSFSSSSNPLSSIGVGFHFIF